MTNGHKKSNLSAQSKILRSLRGPYTQESFAKSLDIPLRTYIRYEKGERPMPRGLLRSAFSIVKSEKSVILIDDSLAFTEEGAAIKEFVDSFKMNLEVITVEEAERRKKDQSNSSTPSIIKPDPWREVLDMARHVLASGTDHAGSLASTIKLSYNAIQAQKLLEEKCDKALNELEQIKQQLSTGRGKVEDADAAQAAAS